MTIGERIKLLRTKNQMTQQALADRVHISRQSISKWEQDLAWPSFANIVIISDTFDVSLDELIRGDAEFIANLERKPHIKILEVIEIGFLIAIVFLTTLLLLGISETRIAGWMSLLQLLSFIFLAVNINWRKINDSLTQWGLFWGIIWFATLAIPAIIDFFNGIIYGLSH